MFPHRKTVKVPLNAGRQLGSAVSAAERPRSGAHGEGFTERGPRKMDPTLTEDQQAGLCLYRRVMLQNLDQIAP
jgi:hypothetical protein